MQFQHDWPKDKNKSSFNFLPGNFEKFLSTDVNDAALEGSINSLYHSSLGHTALESCRLAELKKCNFQLDRM